jgi:DNA-binding NarL/FixJ family response regulator/class 3 adenylate cyclase
MKPVIIYVDDEPMNLTVLEAALPTEWIIHTFDSPLKALDTMSKLDPWIVISDQKMPGMTGVSFLEIVKKTHPEALRVIVTGFSDEDLVVDSIRKAQISDYIKKPWDVDDLAHRMQKLVETYQLEKDIKLKTKELESKNKQLEVALQQVEAAKQQEKQLRIELESWAPPFVLNTIGNIDTFPIRKDLTLITYDLINSSELHSIVVNGKLAKTILMHKFTELVLRYGGWREHHSGDLAYAHFGLLQEVPNPCDIALAVASEFRVFIKNFNIQNGTSIECGIGLHYAKNCLVELHSIEVTLDNKRIVQKSFDTSSLEVDLVFRIEKIAHDLTGTNMILSEEFCNRLNNTKEVFEKISNHTPKGYGKAINVFVKKSNKCTQDELDRLTLKLAS